MNIWRCLVFGTDSEKKHSSSTDTVTEDATHSDNSMAYSRSLYNSYTRNTAPFINDGDTQTVGTYYNWKTATGGMGDTTNTSRPDDSVCPKGWQLPVYSNDKSWDNLIRVVYSAETFTAGDASSGSKEKINGAHIYAISQTMRRAPLSMPFSGSFQFASGKTVSVAGNGLFWSSTSSSTTSARTLYFNSSSLNPQNGTNKGSGFPVRCVAEINGLQSVA